MPKVSVVIPAFNAEATLIRAIDSVLSQTFRDFEVIVCNDGSTDRTREIIKGYGDQVIGIHQENRGRGAARNRCVEITRGDYVAFLDADDWWIKDKLDLQLALAETHPETAVFCGNLYVVNRDGIIYRSLNGKWHVGHSGDVFRYLVRHNFVPFPTVLVRQEALRQTGYFNEGLPRCQDQEFLLRLAARFKFCYQNQNLGYCDDCNWGSGEKTSVTYSCYIQMLDRIRSLFPEQAELYRDSFVKSYSDAYSEIARYHEDNKELDAAAENYRLALEYTPKSRVLQWKRLMALYRSGRFDECLEALNRFIEEDPYHVEAHFYKGNIYLAAGQADKAVEAFENSLYGGYLYQQFPECLNNLGVAYARLGRSSRASEVVEQALQQQEFYSDALWNIENLRQGKPLETLKWTTRKVF